MGKRILRELVSLGVSSPLKPRQRQKRAKPEDLFADSDSDSEDCSPGPSGHARRNQAAYRSASPPRSGSGAVRRTAKGASDPTPHSEPPLSPLPSMRHHTSHRGESSHARTGRHTPLGLLESPWTMMSPSAPSQFPGTPSSGIFHRSSPGGLGSGFLSLMASPPPSSAHSQLSLGSPLNGIVPRPRSFHELQLPGVDLELELDQHSVFQEELRAPSGKRGKPASRQPRARKQSMAQAKGPKPSLVKGAAARVLAMSKAPPVPVRPGRRAILTFGAARGVHLSSTNGFVDSTSKPALKPSPIWCI